ncbi:MAG: hypothetical protein IKN12_07005 [Selenomonadaceae bacterium]|nr:hypothetical protein [Selenomonadaceae bacterium]
MGRLTLFLMITSVILWIIGFDEYSHYAFIGTGIAAILAVGKAIFIDAK